ncbi:unnamed protein product [Rangifer tarandus platyrhynchus]|uniref:Uncharacterized protein n=1 Tax=Rangifer tarandus platyrhynchus TaxID=3082113 RepID=A0ABN8XK10_RANTA|nr:unnamed protein product [Rangifer tarandus platyrhynchus]
MQRLVSTWAEESSAKIFPSLTWRRGALSDLLCASSSHVSCIGPDVAFWTRRKRNSRTASVVFCCLKRYGPPTASGRCQLCCEKVYAYEAIPAE